MTGSSSKPTLPSGDAPASPDPYRELFERSADAILIIEGDRFVDCNAATVRMLRYQNKEELLRTHPSELSPSVQPDGRDSYEKANEMIHIAFTHGSHRFEWDHLRADGEVFPVEVLLTAVERDGKQILHVVWRDITERKQLEDQLRHAQKMEALGKLAGGIAHDFNNLLVAIIGQSDVLLRIIDDPAALEMVEEVKQAGERAARLVRQLMIFSRKQELVLVHLDLRAVLADVQALLQRIIGENITMTLQMRTEPIVVKADKSQLEQIMMNLATNARDAMPDGGELRIELSVVELTDETIGAERLEPGRYALLSVTDTGEGMDARTLGHAFDPFFTTKDVDRGTGLGLATVYGIAKTSGGTATLTSSPGLGTNARVIIPLSREGTVDVLPVAALPTVGGTETILVVEDEPAVSNLELRVLREAGYEVLFAPNGVKALELFLSRAEDIDLVLTDVVMPQMGGPELVKQIHMLGHRKKILFASGYTNDSIARLEELGVAVDLLEKPFSTRELIGRVRIALDRPGQD